MTYVLNHGVLETHGFESDLLKGYDYSGGSKRVMNVYKPLKKAPSYPLVVDLAPYGSTGAGRVSWKLLEPSVPQRIDAMVGRGDIPPCVVVFVDSATPLGGNQFVNSQVLGPWADVIVDEVVPWAEKTYPCGRASGSWRAIEGFSSGGFGALHAAIHRPAFWDGVACQSGDMGFEWIYWPCLAQVSTHLASFQHDFSLFWQDIQKKGIKGPDFMTLMLGAMAASYDPDLNHPLGVRWPVCLETCTPIPERWENWLAFDPIRWSDEKLLTLKHVGRLFIDCGDKDDFGMLFGAKRFCERLRKKAIPHTFDIFEGTHRGISHRIEASLPFLIPNAIN